MKIITSLAGTLERGEIGRLKGPLFRGPVGFNHGECRPRVDRRIAAMSSLATRPLAAAGWNSRRSPSGASGNSPRLELPTAGGCQPDLRACPGRRDGEQGLCRSPSAHLLCLVQQQSAVQFFLLGLRQ